MSFSVVQGPRRTALSYYKNVTQLPNLLKKINYLFLGRTKIAQVVSISLCNEAVNIFSCFTQKALFPTETADFTSARKT